MLVPVRAMRPRDCALRIGVGAFAIAALGAGCVRSGEEAVPTWSERSKADVMAYLTERAQEITDKFVEETASQESWEAVQKTRREELRSMLGIDYQTRDTPLNPQITGRIERDGYSVEKISFESMPKVYVTTNLYLPTERSGPVPTVIYVCGHAYSPHGAKTAYQRHGHTLARHGYAALMIDPIQIAEVAGLHHGVKNQEMYDWYTRGYTPAGLEVWNIIRALDYLETRPEVDGTRFAITGRSGGAAMSWFSTAVEPRIKVAVPIMGMATYAVTVPDDTQRRHCDCMYAVNFHGHDWPHLSALIAPRPLFTAHGRTDALFPVPGYEQTATALEGLYASYGDAERFRHLVVETGHEDSDLLRSQAVKWLDRWLVHREPREVDTSYEEIEPSELAVFGGDPPEDALNYRAHEFFIPDPEPVRPTGDTDWPAVRASRLSALRDTALRGISESDVPPIAKPGNLDAPDGYVSLAFDFDEAIEVEALLRLPAEPKGPGLLYVASPGEDFPATRELLRNLSRFGQNPVLVVYPPGTGTGSWPKSDWKDLLRNAMHTGRSVDGIRIGSVLAAARLLQDRAGADRPVAISGIGEAAGWALYAAALDESIAHVLLVSAPSSHMEGPVLLGALRQVDLPDVAALVAPRRLTFYGSMPPSYKSTVEVYKSLGVESRIGLSMSIGAALNGRFGNGFALGL